MALRSSIRSRKTPAGNHEIRRASTKARSRSTGGQRWSHVQPASKVSPGYQKPIRDRAFHPGRRNKPPANRILGKRHAGCPDALLPLSRLSNFMPSEFATSVNIVVTEGNLPPGTVGFLPSRCCFLKGNSRMTLTDGRLFDRNPGICLLGRKFVPRQSVDN
jgi:hypothetical protein